MAAIALPQFGTSISTGTSGTAEFIYKEIREWRQKSRDSYALGEQAKKSLNELRQVYSECNHPDWDGYGAMPVTADAFRVAYELLNVLPLGMPAPSIGAEPDGHITFEWHHSAHRTLSISIAPDGDLHYAALLGASRHYGTEPFFGDAPKTILDLVYRVYRA
jgi:hypothetical protein